MLLSLMLISCLKNCFQACPIVFILSEEAILPSVPDLRTILSEIPCRIRYKWPGTTVFYESERKANAGMSINRNMVYMGEVI
ncbi:hypothetical protein GGS23DRAFT_590247 [Durotheca rogersii]|uniref:uncharacterized protein n=1 Tax=Durotheca rogersii TaxID=419775 RepID=UPI002220CF98|nr:uncharacterized protein GGS23DRAFT_590247 [Durotheca rogersii]KAI5855023.1 hypothetical protein GGS23DRAFT_590247 [Durotheca rogersii]